MCYLYSGFVALVKICQSCSSFLNKKIDITKFGFYGKYASLLQHLLYHDLPTIIKLFKFENELKM